MVLQTLRSDSKTRWFTGLIVLAVAVYLTIWVGWRLGWNAVTTPDAWALDAAQRVGVRHHGWVTAWNDLCTLLSPSAFRLLALGVIVFALVRRQDYRIAVFLFLSVELSGVVTEFFKRLAERPRPATAMVQALGASFPSGHAMASMVGVLAFAVVLSPHLRRSLWPWAIAAGVLVVVVVGVGRVALNVHYPSDVVAGWALGYLYFALCLPVLRWRGAVTAPDETPATPGTAL